MTECAESGDGHLRVAQSHANNTSRFIPMSANIYHSGKYIFGWQALRGFVILKCPKEIRIVFLDHHALSCSILHMKDTVKSYKCQTLHNFNHFGLSLPSLKASHLRMLTFSASSPFQRFILHYLPRPDGD